MSTSCEASASARARKVDNRKVHGFYKRVRNELVKSGMDYNEACKVAHAKSLEFRNLAGVA